MDAKLLSTDPDEQIVGRRRIDSWVVGLGDAAIEITSGVRGTTVGG